MKYGPPTLFRSHDSASQSKAVAFRACVPAWGSKLIGYLAILGAALSGYAGLQPWAIAAAAIALASLSYAEHHRLYRRANEMGFSSLIDGVILRSFVNALIATGGAYGMGLVFRVF
jgi:hypothetical protein